MAQLPKLFNIPDNYPAQISSEIGFESVQFIKNAPFQPDYWQLWKRIYKLCETYAIENPQALDTSPDLAHALMHALVRLDHADTDENIKYPTWKTELYMKRRGKRFLKFLAQNNPDIYVKFALRLLESTPTKDIEKSYLESQRWLSYHIIYAKSKQIIQKNAYSAYTADWTKFQYNTIQTHAPEIWDNDKYTNEIIALWYKTEKIDVLEWLYYWHKRNNIAFPKFNDAQLAIFFESENSPVLHHLATQQAYQIYTMQGLSANLHACMYFYASNDLRKKIDQIRQNRPKMDDFWQKFWIENYAKIAFSALKNSNKGKRVEKALEYLVNNHKSVIDTLSKKDVFEMSPSLFAMPNTKLQEIAFLKLKNVEHTEVFDWVNAWNNPNRNANNPKDVASFERLLDVAMPIYKKHKNNLYPYQKTISNFFKGEYFMVLFGCKIAIYGGDWEANYALNDVTSYLESPKIKVKELAQKNLHLILSMKEGIDMFLRTFKYSSWTPQSYPDIFWKIAKKCNATKITAYFEEMMINLMTNNVLDNIPKLHTLYPNIEDAKKYLLEKCNDFTKKDIITQWSIYNARQIVIDKLNTLDYRNFASEVLWFVFHNSRCNENTATSCFTYKDYYPGDSEFSVVLWENIILMNEAKQHIFIKVLQYENNVNYFYENAKYMPDNFYEKIIGNADYQATLNFISNLDENGWQKGAKVILKRFFELGQKEKSFWENLLPQITSNENLGKRLLQNSDFVQFFQNQKNPELLNISLPEYEEILFDWLWKNTDLLPMDSQNLFKACLHKLPSLRKFALNYATKQGLSTYFTLKLLESDMPDAMRTAQDFVQNIEANDKIFLENVLAICDSPHRGTRKFAENILLKNKNILLEKYDILNYLHENSDVTIQNFVAKTLTEISKTEQKPQYIQRFTQEIFRQTNRNRQTKEILKKDISLISNTALLEIARTGTPKDKEWAIAQLTLKAIAGEKIEGFAIEV
jgi:hypothetical protein